ncbi:MAG: DUF4199 family protein [Bacteroidia bacterium]
MLKQKSFLFAIVYSVLVIAFKLFIFNSGLQMTKLGMYSHILSLLLITPFILTLVFLERRSRGGQIGGKVALIVGLSFTVVSILILSVFNYIFFSQELGAYIAEYIRANAPKSILEEAAKKGKTLTTAQIDSMVQGGVDDLSAFKDTTSKLFGMLVMGIFSSFVASIFFKKTSNNG